MIEVTMNEYSIDNIAALIVDTDPELKRSIDKDNDIIENKINDERLLLEDEESVEDADDDDNRPTIPEDHTQVTRNDLMGGTSYFDYKNNCLFYHFNELHYFSRIFDGIIRISIDPAKASDRADEFIYGYLKRRDKDGANFHIKNYFGPPSNLSRRAHISFIDSITLYDVISVPRKGYDRWNPYNLSNGRPTDLSQEEMIDELVPNMAGELAVAVYDFLSYYLDLVYFNNTKDRIKGGRHYNDGRHNNYGVRDHAGWLEDAFTIEPCMFPNTNGDYDMEYEFEGLVVGENTYNGLANYTLDIDPSGEDQTVPANVQPVGFEYLDKHDRNSDTYVEVKEIDTFELYRIFARIKHSHEDNYGMDFEDYCDHWANEHYGDNRDDGLYDESDYGPED